jgi:amino acid adenylation domain-containing protein
MSDGRRHTPSRFDLQGAKRELLAELVESEGIESHDAETIDPRACSDKTPLSFAQQRLWFLDQLDSGKSVYNICRAYRLSGPLDVRALTQSVNEIIRRHEVWCTTFSIVDDQPVQVVAPNLTLTIPVLDLQEFTRAGQEAETSHRVAEAARYSFDLERGPLLSLKLLRLDEQIHLLLFTVHQIVCDGWSVGLFFRELASLYRACVNRETAVVPKLPIQFGDYAVWQRRWIKGPIFESQLSYWKGRLDGAPLAFELPTDRPRPRIQTFHGARQPVEVSDSMTGQLKELSRNHNTTLFETLMAAFNALLYRYTVQEDIIVGFPVANRNQTAVQNLIGSFVNTLVLRTHISENLTFSELLSRVREGCRGAYAHQDLPFENLVEELQPQRDMTRNALFQIMFAFQNTPASELDLMGVTVEPVEVNTETCKFDLTLSLTERAQRLVGFFEYSTDLFDRSTVERSVGHFQTLLQGSLANPDEPIATLPILSKAERHQLLVEWNNVEADYPQVCIHELFEAQVQRTPNAIAVESRGKRLTYRELNSQANQLAHYLRKLGTGPETLVGICVERSLEMVIGLLGIFKAGGAYVPLDPVYPRERLAFMLEDAGVSVLLTQAKLIEDRGWRIEDSDAREIIEDGRSKMEDRNPPSSILDPQRKMVCLDRDREKIAQQSERNPDQEATAQNLAYVIYTSGSTGKPKGVQVSHRSVVNCLCAMGQNVALTAKDVFLALTTIAFDIAALELFLPLIQGAKLVLAGRDETLDGRELLDRLTECGATIMQATPSAWKLLVDAGWNAGKGFKILCGGETLSRDLADRLLEGGASLWNLYGPTETTIWSTIAKVEPSENPVPIGRPIANTQIYILDSHLQPVPVGVHGELYISGDGLARGYLHRKELTAEKFIPNPFSDQADARLYRTGDQARYRSDGNIEFLGRFDNQVKIRGYRIELGEIEVVLNQHSAARESVVVARERDSSGEKDLIGYLVPINPSNLSVPELRSFLKEKLPDYMVPSVFIPLEALPLTPNGKIDRNALPPPGGERPELDQGFVEPRTEIEELVAQVWREVLKLDNIGVHDNFFELGGHSLLATRVVARLRTHFNIDLSLRKLFELPTVAELAGHVDLLRRNRAGVNVPPIVPVPRERPIPLSFSQRRLWFLHKLDPGLTAYNIPATFRITGALNIPALRQALDEIVNRHEILRTCVDEIDGQPFQQIVLHVTIELPVVDLSHLPRDQAETEAERLSAEETRRPYDLATAPLMRAKLLRLGDEDHVFILNFHHMVCDGSSLVIFYQELATRYQAFLDAEPAWFAPLPIQYADYAVWQSNGLQGDALESQLDYWKRQLARGLTPLNLPTDYDRPAVQTFRGARLTKALSEESTKALKDLSRREGVSLFMTLLATLDILLCRYTGQDDIIVGSTIAGRNSPETDGLIGFFINALALRTDLSGNPTFLELLKRVREVCLDAYTHQDLPFERVVEEINPERDLSRNPLFQVMFNMADISERVLKLAGCQTVKLSPSAPEAKFDIVLHAPELNGRVELAMVFNADLFSDCRIINVLDQFAHLLSQVADDPQKRLDQYTLVTPSTQAVLPDPTEPLDKSWKGAIHTLFSKQAERKPDQLAIVAVDETWTYRELDRRSNRLARYLIACGIRPIDVVAIYAHRSSALILALLGVLKAGAAFMILDPAYPVSRSISYLRIGRPRGWLQIDAAGDLPRELVDYLDGLPLSCRLSLSSRSSLDFLLEYPKADPGISIQVHDPAYIAFTSGSTGEPKGVLSRHGPVTHFLPWQKEAFDLRATDRFAMLSGLAYTHLHRDVFTALFLGATLYIPEPQDARSPERLAEWLGQNKITVLHLTPALGYFLLTAGERTLPFIRRVFFGGDVLTRQEVEKIREIAPNAKMGSFYGATETQRAVGYFEISEDLPMNKDETKRAIPLGRGIKDVQLLLLNSSGQLAGVGELAELYVRSPHLAECYIGDEKLTAEKFVANPFTNDADDRLYRTGELGRYLPDRNVDWAGRNDRRVNIRGFRVELAEVESVLSQHPAVKDTSVVSKEFLLEGSAPISAHDSRLVAYVVPELDQPLSIDGLRSFLSVRLPDYMVPSHFLILGRLPLTPNGKVDYPALPFPDQLQSTSEGASRPPRTAVERTLSQMFAQVLGREQVGVDENFFRLGGHSLLAAQIAARIRETLGVTLELRNFLETPTVASLASQVELLSQTREATRGAQNKEREEIEL